MLPKPTNSQKEAEQFDIGVQEWACCAMTQCCIAATLENDNKHPPLLGDLCPN